MATNPRESMTDLATAARDLAFLRRRVEGDRPRPPAAIFYLWASVVATGGILTDVLPSAAAIFWPIGSLVAGLLSFWLGCTWSRASGSIQAGGWVRPALHWGGLMGVLALMGFVEGPRTTDPQAFVGGMLLIVGLAYFYAGVHVHRVFFWVAGLEVLGYIVMILWPSTPWSVVGLSIAAGLVGSGIAVTRSVGDETRAANAHLRLET